jgi:hypothetical protein
MKAKLNFHEVKEMCFDALIRKNYLMHNLEALFLL